MGGPIGLLAGLLIGAILSTGGWAIGHQPAWYILWAGGGAAAGYARSWQPSYRLGIWVRVYIGWERFWKAVGLVFGVLIGGALGAVWFFLVLPLFVGLIGGGWVGYKLGEKVYLAGQKYGWERIWATSGAVATAILGGVTAGLVGAGVLGSWPNHQAELLGIWMAGQGASWFIVWAATGGLVGALGGAFSGVLADLVARLAGLGD